MSDVLVARMLGVYVSDVPQYLQFEDRLLVCAVAIGREDLYSCVSTGPNRSSVPVYGSRAVDHLSHVHAVPYEPHSRVQTIAKLSLYFVPVVVDIANLNWMIAARTVSSGIFLGRPSFRHLRLQWIAGWWLCWCAPYRFHLCLR